MTIQPQEGGRRPLDRILTLDFLKNLTTMELTDLRARRQEAEQEEVDLSYARRLLQGRMDLIRAEQATRSGVGAPGLSLAEPRSDEELARDLASVLADENPRKDHGLGRHLTIDPSRVGEHRRVAEQAVDDVRASDPAALTDDELTAAIDHLMDLEKSISSNRHRVQDVMDQLSAEVARRYRDGQARVDDVLAAEAGSNS
ncbi:MAG: aerial mycelium formation protein [Actinomycetota bacterium]